MSAEVAAMAEGDRIARGWVRRGLFVLAIVGGCAGLVGAHVPLCPVAIATGHPCPGCGLTRATLLIARGDLGQAVHLQPFAFVVSPLLLGALALAAWTYVTTGRARLPLGVGRPLERLAPIIAVLMVALWIARFFGVWGGPVPVGPAQM